MTVRLAINGFGRTGRSFLRAALSPRMTSRSWPSTILAPRRHSPDSSLGTPYTGAYPEPVHVEGETMIVGERRIKMLAESEAKALPWQELGNRCCRRVDREVHQAREGDRAPRSRCDPRRDLRTRRRPRRHLRHRGQRGSVRSTSALHHLECVLHDELPRPPRQGAR